MKITKKHRIGIWGFGIVGKAIATYFLNHGHYVGVMDQKITVMHENEYFKEKNIVFYKQDNKDVFFSLFDFIFISAGINMEIIEKINVAFQKKFIPELDFFYFYFKKPIIAITGSIGKTSVTHSLSQIMAAAQIPTFVGGNIGTATFDILDKQHCVNQALLEVSSFQLNYCKYFAPDLAILTNFYPNHLDYHGTEDNYFFAKCMIFAKQTKNQYALIPFALRNKITYGKQHRAYFTTHCITTTDLLSLKTDERLYYIVDNQIIRYCNNQHVTLFAITSIESFTFIENILILVSACDILHFDMNIVQTIASTITIPEHRLEKITTTISIHFYNDSKGTTPASTLAAVEKLAHPSLHLFLGGLSKGINRNEFIKTLHNKTSYIYCFGAEADDLYHMCQNNSIRAKKYSTLTEAFSECITLIQPDDCVLFSPSGSSYDLYNNYQERGNHFKKLVFDFIKQRKMDE